MSANRFACQYCGKDCTSGPGKRAHEKAMHEGISSRSKTEAPGARALLARPRAHSAIATPAAGPSQQPAPSAQGAAAPPPPVPSPSASGRRATISNDGAQRRQSAPSTGSGDKGKRPAVPLFSDQPAVAGPSSRAPQGPAEMQRQDFARDHRFAAIARQMTKLSRADFLRQPVAKRVKYQEWADALLNEQESWAKERVDSAAAKGEEDTECDDYLVSMRARRLEWIDVTKGYLEEYWGREEGEEDDAEEKRALCASVWKRVSEVILAVRPELTDPLVRAAIKKALEEAKAKGLNQAEEAEMVGAARDAALAAQ